MKAHIIIINEYLLRLPENQPRQPMCISRFKLALLLARMAMLWATANTIGFGAELDELIDLPLEQLMNIEVYSASKFPQKKIDAPALVSIVTAQDIQDYGYRTLDEILNSIRGLYTNYDHNYNYLGVRGFSPPGDYNSKILLLIDGYRTNDPAADQASLGTDFLLDVDLIDRVEYVSGPGSALYGNNAFFGVINIITKDGTHYQGGELSGQYGSFGYNKERGTYGKQFDNGANLLLSGSHQYADGQNLFFQEFNAPGSDSGKVRHEDAGRADRLFGKFSYRGFKLEGGFVNRKQEIPTASFGQLLGSGGSFTIDRQYFLDLSYSGDLSDTLNLYAHAYSGSHNYDGDYVYIPPTLNKDRGRANWAGTELKFVSTYFDRHKLVVGGEYQNNFDLQAANFDVNPYLPYTESDAHNYRYSFYAQDDFNIIHDLALNAGLRYDYYNTFGDTVNPRAALIYKPWDSTAFKLLYGTAFRAPNAYELYYASGSSRPNPDLQPEKIATYEVVIEHQPSNHLRMAASGFRYQISDLINLTTDNDQLTFRNQAKANAWGTEAEIEYFWENGTRLRGSYTWVDVKQQGALTDGTPPNSPGSLVKLNLSLPIWDKAFRLGSQFLYTGGRKTLLGRGKSLEGYPVVDLTLRTDQLFKGQLKGFEVSASVYNLFDQTYFSVAGEEHCDNLGACLNGIPQVGRNFRAMLNYRF